MQRQTEAERESHIQEEPYNITHRATDANSARPRQAATG